MLSKVYPFQAEIGCVVIGLKLISVIQEVFPGVGTARILRLTLVNRAIVESNVTEQLDTLSPECVDS
jgi:hypothetical protein